VGGGGFCSFWGIFLLVFRWGRFWCWNGFFLLFCLGGVEGGSTGTQKSPTPQKGGVQNEKIGLLGVSSGGWAHTSNTPTIEIREKIKLLLKITIS